MQASPTRLLTQKAAGLRRGSPGQPPLRAEHRREGLYRDRVSPRVLLSG